MSIVNVILALAAKGLNIPVVGSKHSHLPKMPLGKARECLRRQNYQYLSVVTALTNESAKWLSTHTKAKNATIIANAVTYLIIADTPISKEIT